MIVQQSYYQRRLWLKPILLNLMELSTIDNEGGIWHYDGKTFKNYNTSD